MKIALFLASTVLLAFPLKSQYWKFVDFEANSTENSFFCLEFVSSQKGWVAGSSGALYHTNDGGQIWEDLSIPYEARIYTIEFVNDTIGYLSTDIGIFATDNGGITWQLVNDEILGSQYYKTIGFFDENIGWALDGQAAFKTVDGGNTWEEVDVPNTSVGLVNVYPLTEDICFLGGTAGYVYATYNGGLSWESHKPLSLAISNISFFDNCQGQFYGYGRVSLTDDCGESFSGVKQLPIGRIAMISEEEGWTMNGVNGVSNIYHTYNSWDSWEAQFISNFIGLHNLSFENPELGWVVGDRETILKTEDGGNTWTINKIQGPELNSVYYYSAESKWSVGENGLIYFKGLENAEWVIVNSPVNTDLNSVYFSDSENGWIVGDSGVLLKTSNGGLDWEMVNLPISSNDLNSVLLKSNFGMITGDDGMVLTTSDFGNSWILSNAGTTNDLLKASITENGNFIVIGRAGTYLLSQDNGNTWNQVNQFDSSSDLKSITFPSSERGWLISDNGKVYRTDDEGSNWFENQLFDDVQLNDVLFTSEEKGWIIGNDGVLLSSEDGGETWNQDDFNIDVDLRSISFPAEGTGYIVGEKGTFMRYLPFTVSTENIANQEKVVIYPNPTYGFLKVQVNEEKLIELIQVYSLSGKSIKKFYNINSSMLDINLAGLAKGIYVVSITCDGETVNRKVVIQ